LRPPSWKLLFGLFAVLLVANAATTTASAIAHVYDVPAVARVEVEEPKDVPASPGESVGPHQESALPRVEARGTSTTLSSLSNATEAGGVGPAGARGVYDPPGGVAGQIHDYSCVAASCSMVGGGPEAYWRAAAGTTADGTRLADAASALTEGGVPSTYQTGLSIGDLEAATANGPSIVAGNGHALVVDRISGGQVFIRDPWPQGVGSSYSVSVSDFSSWWSGRAVVPGA